MAEQSLIPSTVSVLEDFFGEPLGPSLTATVLETPLYQLVELADRLSSHHAKLQYALNRRTPEQLLNPIYRGFAGEDYVVHDRIYLRGDIRGPVDDFHMKHLLLYSPRVLLPDRTLDWADEVTFLYQLDQLDSEARTAVDLADALYHLFPFLDLIRAGHVVPIGSAEAFAPDFDPDDAFNYPLRFKGDLDVNNTSIYWQDPYLAWLLVNKLECIPRWELDLLDLSEPASFQEAASYYLGNTFHDGSVGHRCAEAVRLACGDAHIHDLGDAVQMGVLSRESRVTPMTSGRLSGRHLTRSSQVIVDGLSSPHVDQSVPGADSIRYQVPSLAHVSMPDISRMRLQEDIYEDVRNSLTDLANAVSSEVGSGGYREYVSLVRECANDYVRPTYDRLNRQAKRAGRGALVGGFGSGAAVTLALNGIAYLFAPPAALALRGGANVSGNVIKSAVESKIKQRSRKGELETARSILFEVLPPSPSIR